MILRVFKVVIPLKGEFEPLKDKLRDKYNVSIGQFENEEDAIVNDDALVVLLLKPTKMTSLRLVHPSKAL